MRRHDFVRAAAGTLAVVSVPGVTQRALASDVVDVTLRSCAAFGFRPGRARTFRGWRITVRFPGRCCAWCTASASAFATSAA